MREHPDYPGYYVTPDGKVYSDRTGIMREKVPQKGRRRASPYYDVGLNINGKRYNRYIHRLVAEVYMPEGNTGDNVVNHLNGDKLDNRVENLEWVTQKENVNHKPVMVCDGYIADIQPLHTNTWWIE